MRYGLVVALGFVLSGSVAAKADSTGFPVSGSTPGFSGTGTLTATANGDGSYTVFSIAGGITGSDVTGLIGVHGFNGNDNLLFPSKSSVLDGQGLGFTAQEGNTSYQVDVFADGDSYSAHILDSDNASFTVPVTFTLDGMGDPDETQSRVHTAMLATDVRDFKFSYATVDAVAATPEPTSFALMGTGLLGLAGAVRRRMRS